MLERRPLVIRLCMFDTIKFKGGFQIYVICILQGLHSYLKLVIQDAQKVLNY